MAYGLLIDTEYCSGCFTCEVACRKEKDLPVGQYGIKVLDLGPFLVDEAKDYFVWDHVPQVSELCDLCEERVQAGKRPACAHHCPADAIEYGALEELVKKMAERGSKMNLIIP